MIVGVEPLGHLHGRHVLAAARHGKAGVEVHFTGDGAEARRDGAERGGHVEHVIVERKVVRWDHPDAGLRLQPPVARAQLAPHGLQRRAVELALPVDFRRRLQLPAGADSGKSEVRRLCHDRRRRRQPAPAKRGRSSAPAEATPRDRGSLWRRRRRCFDALRAADGPVGLWAAVREADDHRLAEPVALRLQMVERGLDRGRGHAGSRPGFDKIARI